MNEVDLDAIRADLRDWTNQDGADFKLTLVCEIAKAQHEKPDAIRYSTI